MDEKSQWRKEREIDVSGKVRKQLHFSWKNMFSGKQKREREKFGEERERETRDDDGELASGCFAFKR